jgi:hypothetical protein
MPQTPGQARVIRWLFIGLVPCLFAQLWLRRYTEPYPAILLPSGATLVRTASETILFAEDADGQQHPLPPSALLDTVPTDYRGYVIRRGFGLIKDRDVRYVRIPFPGGGLVQQLGRPLTPSQREETRLWLRSKLLRTSGIDAVRIHILKYRIQVLGEREELEDTPMSRSTVELLGAAP